MTVHTSLDVKGGCKLNAGHPAELALHLDMAAITQLIICACFENA
jgi:hypothetical protein